MVEAIEGDLVPDRRGGEARVFRENVHGQPQQRVSVYAVLTGRGVGHDAELRQVEPR